MKSANNRNPAYNSSAFLSHSVLDASLSVVAVSSSSSKVPTATFNTSNPARASSRSVRDASLSVLVASRSSSYVLSVALKSFLVVRASSCSLFLPFNDACSSSIAVFKATTSSQSPIRCLIGVTN